MQHNDNYVYDLKGNQPCPHTFTTTRTYRRRRTTAEKAAAREKERGKKVKTVKIRQRIRQVAK